MIPDINIWRVANLMLKRYGDLAEVESARRADELWEVGDAAGVAVWRRVAPEQHRNCAARRCPERRSKSPDRKQKRPRLLRGLPLLRPRSGFLGHHSSLSQIVAHAA